MRNMKTGGPGISRGSYLFIGGAVIMGAWTMFSGVAALWYRLSRGILEFIGLGVGRDRLSNTGDCSPAFLFLLCIGGGGPS